MEKAYVGQTGTNQKERNMKYRNCDKSRFKCSEKVSNDDATAIFATYWSLGSHEKQRNFICQHVVQLKVKRGVTYRKFNSDNFFLTVNETKQGVCKQFFLGVLDISKKTVDFALRKKAHDVFTGKDERGKAPAFNKTPDIDRNFIKNHTESFPTCLIPLHMKRFKKKIFNCKLVCQKNAPPL